MRRIVLHLDMDYFYAAIEERENPELKGRPVVVCVYSARGEGKGAVSTANYEARKRGVSSGMSCPRAKKLAPEAVFLPVNFELYEGVSENIMGYLRGQGNAFEQGGIDEAFLEVTGRVKSDYKKAEELAREIKKVIRLREGLSCSIGVAPNKLLAKIASGYRKPDGLTVVEPSMVQGFLRPMKTSKLWGVGKKTAEELREMGIITVGDLTEADPITLVEKFGKAKGAWLYSAARGLDDDKVEVREAAQLSRITTLPRNTRKPEEIEGALKELVRDLHTALKEQGFSFRTVSFIAVTAALKTHTKSRTLSSTTDEETVLLGLALELMEAFLKERDLDIRRVGVRVSGLGRAAGQKSLLDYGR